MIERRLAERNGLAVGDTLRLRSADGRRSAVSRIVGVFRDPTRDPARPMPSHMLPGNLLYVPMASARRLGTGPARVDRAVYRIGSPDRAERLHAEAVRVLGGGGLRFTVNDKAYRDQVRPIQRVGAFADLVVHVIALAGALILSLLVTLQVRERRGELGVLLALGEKKWKLLGQHVVEVAAVALPALALAALAGALGGQRVGDAFLDHHGDGDTDSRSSSGSGSGSGSGTVAAGAPDTPSLRRPCGSDRPTSAGWPASRWGSPWSRPSSRASASSACTPVPSSSTPPRPRPRPRPGSGGVGQHTGPRTAPSSTDAHRHTRGEPTPTMNFVKRAGLSLWPAGAVPCSLSRPSSSSP